MSTHCQALQESLVEHAGKLSLLGQEQQQHLARGVARRPVGGGGLLSTPAASCIIRKHRTNGGIILSASHNPDGPDGDFGIKFNTANGGPAPEKVTEAIFQRTRSLHEYRILDTEDIDLDTLECFTLGEMHIEIIDPVSDYAELMAGIFDFEAIRGLLAEQREGEEA